MTAERAPLSDDDVERIAEAVARRLLSQMPAANDTRAPTAKPIVISETVQRAAEAELKRRGLLYPKRR